MVDGVLRRRSAHSDEANPYWISFADIMAGILIVFILAVVVLILQLQQRQAALTDLRATILLGIQAELRTKGIIVNVDESNTVLTIPEETLSFKQNEYRIPEPMLENVAEIGRVIYSQIGIAERYKEIDTIFIEGHTDSVPARRFPLGNWGLSSSRAIAVWTYWVGVEDEQIAGAVPELADMTNRRCDPQGRCQKMFSVSGYADTRRLEPEDDTPEKQKTNRRIDVRFSMRAPVFRDITNINQVF